MLRLVRFFPPLFFPFPTLICVSSLHFQQVVSHQSRCRLSHAARTPPLPCLLCSILILLTEFFVVYPCRSRKTKLFMHVSALGPLFLIIPPMPRRFIFISLIIAAFLWRFYSPFHYSCPSSERKILAFFDRLTITLLICEP